MARCRPLLVVTAVSPKTPATARKLRARNTVLNHTAPKRPLAPPAAPALAAPSTPTPTVSTTPSSFGLLSSSSSFPGSGIINLVASLAYLTMALGYGYTTKCNGRDFYYARYVDWAITTPIMLWDLVTIADGNRSHEVDRIFLAVIDFIMIIAGLVGELIDGTEKWAFFGFSMLLFCPIMYFLCELADITVANGESRTPVQELFRRIAAITIISWMGYPIIWVLASVHGSSSSCHVGGYATEAVGYGAQATQEAGYRMLQSGAVAPVGIITVQGEAYAYTVLDIIAKTLMGWVIVCFQPAENPPTCRPAKAIAHSKK